ncbi:MAG TPA: alpha/beta hydrolase-fold protein [Opitutus sp.]|nr:alpha/beta hydrolase-fold protein [Opitutus sp.]
MNPAFTLCSPENGTDYSIFVSTPAETLSASLPVPAVIFMDGDDQFSAAVRAYRAQRKSNLVPPLLIAGVGYGASYSKPGNRRGRDYTPTAHPDEPTSGGAHTFLRFLSITLWPELVRRFPVREDVRGIAGHSLGSLLVLHALWQEPPFFTHHLASAPSIWWDDRSILRLAAERHARKADLKAHLFLSVGESDTKSMTADFSLLEQQLHEQPFTGLRVTSRRFPRRNHFDVLPDAFGAGLIALFNDNSVP